MKVAILGGGFTGLTAAYYASLAGHQVTIFEKDPVLGGLASGFRSHAWKWNLERAYHHLFKNDSDIQGFARDVSFRDIYFVSPETASLFDTGKMGGRASTSFLSVKGSEEQGLAPSEARGKGEGRPRFSDNVTMKQLSNFSIIPMDSPQDLLRFPYLTLPQRVRTGAVLAFLKASPFLKRFERESAEHFLRRTMGDQVWDTLWRELFRKKFGKYAGNILASFIWARIKKRTPQLGYIKGGFQRFITHTEGVLHTRGVTIRKGTSVTHISSGRNVFRLEVTSSSGQLEEERFDAVICTLPSPIIPKITSSLFPQHFLMRFEKLKFLHAVNLIIESRVPILGHTYWLNIMAPNVPFMVLVQHTNFVNRARYGGHHIAYVGRYVSREDPILKMNKEEILKHWLSHLDAIAGRHMEREIINTHLFKGPFAQPIFDREFLRNKPTFETPVKRFYIANLDMTYPYDRGTNYAVALGRDVVHYL